MTSRIKSDVVEVEAFLIGETDCSYTISVGDPSKDRDDDKNVWLPKSLVTLEDVRTDQHGERHEGCLHVFSMPEWLAIDRELECISTWLASMRAAG